MDIDKLIEELEEADYGSKDLDLKVAMVNNPNLTDLPDYLAIWPSAYTTSVDAALGLVPEKFRTKGEPGRIFIEHKLGQFWSCQIRMHAEDGWWGMSWAPYPSGPALAICGAVLKARKEKE